ncbi:MAG: phytanoyl-CoA dioxygenase family protein, partial [Sphingobium limneticum]
MSAAVDRHAAMLSRDGWCVFGRAIEPAVLTSIEMELEPRFAATPLCQGAFYGERTRRFGSLLTRASAIERLVMHPL